MRIVLLLLAFLAGIIPASAEADGITIPGDLCGQLAVDWAQPLAGEWHAVNRDGGGSVGPRGVLLKNRPTENLKLVYSSRGKLIFTGRNDMGPQRMEMVPQSEPPNLPDRFNVRLPNRRIVEIDVKALLPCAWDKMPGYKGHVDYPLPGVGEMRMTVVFNFPSKSMGFGLLHFTGSMMGRSIDVWRYVTLTRSMSGVIPCKEFKCKSDDPEECRREHEKARKKDKKICPFPEKMLS